MSTSKDQEREAFEHYFSDRGRNPRSVERGSDGKYLLGSAHNAWRVWQARAAMAPAGEPVAYLYRDAQTPEDAHPWLNSTMLVLAADRRQTLRNETPLYAHPSTATDRVEVLRLAREMVQAARTETACRLAGNSAFKSYADKHGAAESALVRLLGVE